eukprot:gene2157-2656_t
MIVDNINNIDNNFNQNNNIDSFNNTSTPSSSLIKQRVGGNFKKSTSSTPTNTPLEKLKLFDFYPKLDENVPQQKTIFGGVATIICIVITLEHALRVDRTKGNKLSINIDIHFPSLICNDIVIDCMDGVAGKAIKEGAYQIIKQRYDSKGDRIAEGRSILGNKGIFSKFECTPCELPYEKKSGIIFQQRCCNTCDDLRTFYRSNKIPQHFADNKDQCLIEKPVTDDEGCRIVGTLEVAKIKGDFHMIIGASSDQQHDSHSHHIHEMTKELFNRIHKFNISHHIHQFSFGNHVEGLINPLEGTSLTVSGLGLQSYYIQVVPTIYRQNNFQLETNQYSYTYDYKPIHRGNFGKFLPGIYFKYDMSPLMIEVDQTSKPLVELITSVSAICGGIYVFIGIIRRVVDKVYTRLNNKK